VQLPQLYRRGVVRPLDDDAARELAAFRVATPIRVEWLPILGDDKFADLWAAGLFQQINKACKIEISDYEEVELKAREVPKALRVIDNMDYCSEEINAFVRHLRSLLADAATSGRCVYFVF